jgi:hypothetical protein
VEPKPPSEASAAPVTPKGTQRAAVLATETTSKAASASISNRVCLRVFRMRMGPSMTATSK